MDKRINKTELTKLIKKDLKSKKFKVELYEVLNILSVLLEEIKIDILSGKSIDVINFCSMSYQEKKTVPHPSVYTGEKIPSRITKVFFMKLSFHFRKLLLKNLDFDATFPEFKGMALKPEDYVNNFKKKIFKPLKDKILEDKIEDIKES